MSDALSKSLCCYAEGRAGDWEAICLDLDIAVQGASFDEVRGSLQEAINLFLDAVAGLPPQERWALHRRPAPVRVSVKVLAQVLRGLFPGRDGDRERHQFTLPLAPGQHYQVGK